MSARAWIVMAATAAMAVVLGGRAASNIWLGTGAVASASLLACAWLERARLVEWLRLRPDALVLGVAAGALSVALTWAGYGAGVALWPGLEEAVARLHADLDDWPGPRRAAPVLALVVLAEECVWRGLLLDGLGRSARAVALGALVYAIPQLLTGSAVLWGVALAGGLLWGALRARTGGLVAPIAAHAIWDALVFSGGLLR